MAEKRLVRSSTNKMVAGVAAGLADYLDLDPSIVRILFVVLALLGGPGILLYIIMWIIMPEGAPTTSTGSDVGGGAGVG